MRYVNPDGSKNEDTANIYVTLDKTKSLQTIEGIYPLEECIV